MASKRIAIVGVTGFLGRHLARGLSEAGHTVLGISRSGKAVPGCSEHVKLDMLVSAGWTPAFENVDTVIHCGGITDHAALVDDPYASLKVNLEGTQNVLSAFQASGATQFVYPSSGKVYGLPKGRDKPFKEDTSASPVTFLGRYKLLIEDLIRFYAQDAATSGKTYSILRVFNVYGPQQRDHFLVPTILKQLAGSNEVTLGDIDAKKDFLYVSDVVGAFLAVIEAQTGTGVEIFNVGSGKAITPKLIVDTIAQIKSVPITIKTEEGRMRPEERYVEAADLRHLHVLGWKQQVDLKAGLVKTVEAHDQERKEETA